MRRRGYWSPGLGQSVPQKCHQSFANRSRSKPDECCGWECVGTKNPEPLRLRVDPPRGCYGRAWAPKGGICDGQAQKCQETRFPSEPAFQVQASAPENNQRTGPRLTASCHHILTAKPSSQKFH